jgi:hypothetical protein
MSAAKHLAERFRAASLVVAVACSWGCGGEVASQDAPANTTPSTAAGVYALDSGTIAEDPATSAFGSNVMPLLRALCPDATASDFTLVTSVDATGGGKLVVTTPCAVYHVPVIAAAMTMLGETKGTFSAIVPTESLVTTMRNDLAQSSGAPCGDPSLDAFDAPIRGSSNLTVSLDDGPNIAAMTLLIDFGAREPTSDPAPATAHCQ